MCIVFFFVFFCFFFLFVLCFFFNDTATTEIYTLSLHDALPISRLDELEELEDELEELEEPVEETEESNHYY